MARVSPAYLDLLSLESPDEDDHVGICCGSCGSKLEFSENYVDPPESRYYCPGKKEYYGFYAGACTVSISKAQAKAVSEDALEQYFYTQSPEVSDFWKMRIEYNVGKVAYHYMDQATHQEKCDESLKRLETLRQRAKKAAKHG